MAQTLLTRPKVEKTCEVCKTEFFVYPYRAKTARFCTHACYATTVHKQEKTEGWYQVMQGRTPWNKGQPWDEETRQKLSKSQKERFGREDVWNKGKPHEAIRGENHYNWQGGKTNKNRRIRHLVEYRVWREAVFKRDDYTCQDCQMRDGRYLHAHHIKPFALFPELRFAIDNGLTLCIECHKKTDSYLNPSIKPQDY